MQEITQDREVVEIQNSTGALETKVTSLVVTDEPSSKYATDLLSFIKKAHRKIEAKRKFFVAPLNEHVKDINNFFKSMTEPLKNYEGAIKDKMLSYHRECQMREAARQREEQAKADAMAKDLSLPKVEIEQKEVKTQTQGSMGKTYVQKVWTYDVVDIGLVPKDYIVIGTSAVGNAIRSGIRDIPGLKIYQKETIGSR